MAHVRTPIVISGGWLEGRAIRRARKEARCDNWRLCPTKGSIKPGELYAEYECDPDTAGGFGMKKLCIDCAGEEARLAILAAEAAP